MIAAGQTGMIKAYRTLGSVLKIMKGLGVAPLIIEAAIAVGVYPSVLYTVGRAPASVGRPRSGA